MIYRNFIFIITLMIISSMAQAHKPSDSYLWLKLSDETSDMYKYTLRWDISLRDLETLIGLDVDGDGDITWEELQSSQSQVYDVAIAGINLSMANESCMPTSFPLQTIQHTDGGYAVLETQWLCSNNTADENLILNYKFLADIDPSHRGLLQLGDNTGLPFILGPENNRITFNAKTIVSSSQSHLATFWHFIREGIWHILIGFDHLLFLFTLLLPAVWLAKERIPATSGQSTRELFKVITAFTLAHSITLAVATLGLYQPPSRFIESAIALSIVITAINNLTSVLPVKRWVVAFAFGLIHGFGFASVLIDLGLPSTALAISLLGFNLGVEVGQLAIVALVFPWLFLMRRKKIYRTLIHGAGSVFAAVIGMLWFLERSLDLKIFEIS